ncbi:MAG TPA: helix-turn-helix domain-containing protein [Gemmatimonadaceae bacterium]|nr:helix-turn-helix domain-containing protein [Gemmatimonadaceae bacterium]
MLSIPAPAGYRGTRGDLLVALKKSQPLTAKELAERFGVTANALRRHLKELEAEGVVTYRREIRGVGGPVFAYSLTPAGEALFPRAYERALAEVLDLVREQQGEAGIVQLFQRRWDQIAAAAKPGLEHLPVEKRAQRLAELLTSLGYMAEVHAEGSALPLLTEHNCAIRLVAERFPEICTAEERFISELLGVTVTRQAHIAKGANCCEYCISTTRSEDTGPRPEASTPLRTEL